MYLPVTLQITFIAHDHQRRPALARLFSVLALNLDQVGKVAELVEGLDGCDVVDEEEGVAVHVGGTPHATVLFLAGCVCDLDVVGLAFDCARDGVRVFDRRVVFVRPLSSDDAEGDG